MYYTADSVSAQILVGYRDWAFQFCCFYDWLL